MRQLDVGMVSGPSPVPPVVVTAAPPVEAPSVPNAGAGADDSGSDDGVPGDSDGWMVGLMLSLTAQMCAATITSCALLYFVGGATFSQAIGIDFTNRWSHSYWHFRVGNYLLWDFLGMF